MADETEPADEADATPLFDPAAHGWEVAADAAFIELVGPFWRRRDDPGSVGFLAAPKHKNLRGVVQGGMLMTFADRALGTRARLTRGGQPQATVQLSVNFLDAVHVGDFVEADTRVDRQTRSLSFLSGTLRVGTRPVATAQGIWKALQKTTTDPNR